MIGGVLVARHHLDVKDEPHIRQHIAVIDVARPARLLRIVPELSSLLVSIEWLNRRIGIEHPVFAEQRRRALVQMATQPSDTRRLRYRLEGPANGILAHDARQAEQLGQYTVGPQGRHVRVALVARQHRQHRRAEHVALVRRIRVRVVEWTVRNQGVKHPDALRNSMKNDAWPSGVRGASGSHSACTRPAQLSSVTPFGRVLRSTAGCPPRR